MGVFRSVGRTSNIFLGGAAKNGVKLVTKVISKKNENVGRYIDEIYEKGWGDLRRPILFLHFLNTASLVYTTRYSTVLPHG